MNASHIAETVSAIDVATSYLMNVPYTTNADHAERRDLIRKLGDSRGRLSYELQKIKVEVANA